MVPYFLYIIDQSLINTSCKPTLYEINTGPLINTGGVTQSHITIIATAMATNRKVYAVTTKLQTVEVAERTSKEAVAKWAENSQLTVGTATNMP